MAPSEPDAPAERPDAQVPSPWSRDVLIGGLAMVICALLVVPTFLSNGGDPTLLLRVGTYAPARPYVERAFPDPVLTPDYGHDGQQFYVVASAFPDLRAGTPYVDNIHYRARRILFPLLASPFRSGPALVWAMFAINLLAVGAGAVAMARIARQLRAPPLIGLLVGANPAMVESLQGSLGDALAFSLALWGVALWRRHLGWGVLLLTLAALSRETTLVVAAACFLVGDRRAKVRLTIPFAVVAAWSLVLIAWLPLPATSTDTSFVSEVTKQLGWPFQGWSNLGWTDAGTLTAAVLLAIGLASAYALWNVRRELAWWLLFDGLLLVVSAPGVLERPFNIARIAPLVLPAAALALTAGRGARAPRPALSRTG
jgi:hypothetical protein